VISPGIGAEIKLKAIAALAWIVEKKHVIQITYRVNALILKESEECAVLEADVGIFLILSNQGAKIVPSFRSK
jgi:hypothetical protein